MYKLNKENKNKYINISLLLSSKLSNNNYLHRSSLKELFKAPSLSLQLRLLKPKHKDYQLLQPNNQFHHSF